MYDENINIFQVGAVARIECGAEGRPTPEISLEKEGSDDFPAARERRLLFDAHETTFFVTDVQLVSSFLIFFCFS